ALRQVEAHRLAIAREHQRRATGAAPHVEKQGALVVERQLGHERIEDVAARAIPPVPLFDFLLEGMKPLVHEGRGCSLYPFPVGEGKGERASTSPLPDPLPKGEGTSRAGGATFSPLPKGEGTSRAGGATFSPLPKGEGKGEGATMQPAAWPPARPGGC